MRNKSFCLYYYYYWGKNLFLPLQYNTFANELFERNSWQNTANGTVVKSLPQNRVILPKSLL